MVYERLTDGDEVLFRQIHPSFLQRGEPSSAPFSPTLKDGNKLSVDRSSITTATLSHELYKTNGHYSVAVYGVTVGKFEDEKIDCCSDPLEATDVQKANPAHAFADYSSHSANQQKIKAKRLKRKALARGCLHT